MDNVILRSLQVVQFPPGILILQENCVWNSFTDDDFETGLSLFYKINSISANTEVIPVKWCDIFKSVFTEIGVCVIFFNYMEETVLEI